MIVWFIVSRLLSSDKTRWSLTTKMGSFIGHAIPGTFFMLMGIWWMVNVLRRLYQSKKANAQPFRSKPSLVTMFGHWRFDPESAFAVFAALVGLMVELRGIYLPTSRVKPHHIQHATMYFFFGLAGLLGILRNKLEKHLPFVESLHYALLMFSFAVEALLFQFHLYGRDELDVVLHLLLVKTAWLCALVCLLEMCRPDVVMLPLARAFLTCVQGTWFWQVGFVLYNPVPGAAPWDPEDHHQLMLVACIYSWHIGVVMVLSILLAVLVSVCCERRKQKEGVCQKENYALEQVNGYTKLLAEVDDAEFCD